MSSDAFDPEQPLPPPVEDWAARIDELLLEAETAPAGAERTAVLCRISEIYERRLGDPSGALVTLQTALAEDPDQRAGDPGDGTDRARATASGASSPRSPPRSPRASRITKQAAIFGCRSRSGTRPGARSSTRRPRRPRRALTLEPAHGGALALLENLYRRQRHWDRYVEILARRRHLPGTDPSKLRRCLPGGAALRAAARRRARWSRPAARGEWRMGCRRGRPAPPHRRAARGSGPHRGAVSAGKVAHGTAPRSARRRGAAGARAGGGRRRDARAEPASARRDLPRAEGLVEGATAARARRGGGDRRGRQDAHPG